MTQHNPPLSHDDRLAAFIAATSPGKAAAAAWAALAYHGASDEQITALLTRILGISGGQSGRPGIPSIWYHGAGLKIWADREFAHPYRGKPIFKGDATISMVREVYHIPDPTDPQRRLL